MHEKVVEALKRAQKEVSAGIDPLLKSAESLLCVNDTSLLIQIGNRLISVDWETGRLTGGGDHLPIGSSLPVYLRKHNDFAPLGHLLRHPLPRSSHQSRIHFQGAPVSIDISTGAAWLTYGEQEYRLVSKAQTDSIGLPDSIREGFSVWLNEKGGIISAHSKDGIPHPSFYMDVKDNRIRPLHGNQDIYLASSGYYSEAQLFSRWGQKQSNILVWLDNDHHVAELHLPLHNGKDRFTRVIRSEDGKWCIEGLDLFLESTTETIPAFAGHPVYLVSRNKKGQRFLLLPGATPFELKDRKMKKLDGVDWNDILSTGAKEGIHQYRILSSGQIEGLTVHDNLLLMFWTFYMGHYASTAQLAKRWLTPPGRPYNKEEQLVLFNWIENDYFKRDIDNETHPSALALRLFIIVRMTRHLRDYPLKRSKGEKAARLWSALLGERSVSYRAKEGVAENLMKRNTLGRQIRGTHFEDLFSQYDHEAAIRLCFEKERRPNDPVVRRLYQRQENITEERVKGTTLVACNIYGREIHHWSDEPKWGEYTFKQILGKYPTTVQSNIIPVEGIYRSIVDVNVRHFFDRAYALIKEGARTQEEIVEYRALLYAIGNLRGDKSIDICIEYFQKNEGYYSENIREENLMLWLLLEQVFIAQTKGEKLPELPNLNKRFGLLLKSSLEGSKKFFKTIAELNGMNPGVILLKYRKEWFAKRGIRYLKQDTVSIDPPSYFESTLNTPWPEQLTSEIRRWRYLNAPLEPNKTCELDITVDGWTIPMPKDWIQIPFDEKGFHLLQKRLLERLKIVRDERIKREKTILMLANALPTDANEETLEFARQIHYVSPITVDECIGLALVAKNSNWKKSCPVSSPMKLQRHTLLFVEMALEEQHLQRIKMELELCLECPDDQDRQIKLKENLSTHHSYEPCSATLPLMVAEYYTNCRLRTNPDQAHLTDLLSQESTVNRGAVIQAIMGSGKSKMLAPAWAQMMLGTGRIPIICVPNSLFRTTLSDLQNMMWDRFKTNVRALTFTRESCNKESLYALAETFHIARLEPTVFLCTPRDLHALQLMLKERHQLMEDMRNRLTNFTLIWAKSALAPEVYQQFRKAINKNCWHTANGLVPSELSETFNRWQNSYEKLENELYPLEEESNLLQAILNLLQFEGALLVDEVATVYDPRNQLSFPIGWQVPANPQASVSACKTYFEWLPQFFDKLGLLKDTQTLVDESSRKAIYRRIAKLAWQEYNELIPGFPPMKIFTAYLMSLEKGKPMEAFVFRLNEGNSAFMKQLAQEIAFLKYTLTSSLDGAFASKLNVNHGRSIQDPHLQLSIPYWYANIPKENTLFKMPWKTVTMSCQYYTQVWNDPNQTAELIGYLQGIDPTSKDQSILQAATTIWGKRYTQVDLQDKKGMEKLTEELNQARLDENKSPAARMLIQNYLKSCVFSTQLKLDPSSLTSTAQDLPMMVAKADAMGGTFGFETTWNPRLARYPDHSSDATILKALAEKRNQTCHILPKGGPDVILDLFEKGLLKGYMALLDVGARFKGISNATVAKRLLAALKGFDCVLYFEKGHLAVMSAKGTTILEQSDREGVRRALSQMNLSQPFVYYDQGSCIGADLELPTGIALVTFSDTLTKDDLIQGCSRCRLIGDGRHSIEYAIPGEMEGDWTGDLVIETATAYQKKIEEKANFHAICEQLRGEARSVIDRAMRSTPNTSRRSNLHKAAAKFLMEEQSNDLVKNFGSIQKMVSGERALKRLVRRLVRQIDAVLPDFKESTKRALLAILEWHDQRNTSIPDLVREGDEFEEAVKEVDLSKDQDRMRLMEEEYERMLGTRNSKKEIPWKTLDLKLITPCPIGSLAPHEEMPSLYTLADAIKERGFIVPFDSNLMMSANLLSTFLGEANCLLTDNQKPLHRGLFIRSDQGPKYVLVTEGDARHLKELLLSMPPSRGVYLVEPSGCINQRSCREEQIVNLWKEGTIAERSLLLQALLFQGSALLLDQLPKVEVVQGLKSIVKQKSEHLIALRILFETALDFRPDDMLHYRRSHTLRALFSKF